MPGKIAAKNSNGFNIVMAREWRRKPTCEEGFTLVEVMIAFLVLLITSLALMQTALVSIEANMKNVVRDEAVAVAEMEINNAKSSPFDDLDSDGSPDTLPSYTFTLYPQRTLKNIQVTYTAKMTATQLDSEDSTKQFVVTVTWKWKGQDYTHTSSTILRRPT
jgi:type IV pilus assembly protein PilV